jgi:hypothetical protein
MVEGKHVLDFLQEFKMQLHILDGFEIAFGVNTLGPALENYATEYAVSLYKNGFMTICKRRG